MQMPLIYAIAPDATVAALPEAALPGYMGFSLCDEPPFFLKPAAIPPVSDGWILIQDSEFPPPERLCDCVAAVREYLLQAAPAGVYLDFEAPPDDPREDFVWQLDQALHALQLPLVVPEAYIPATAHAMACIPARLSGGTLQQRLQEAVQHYQNGVCVELILGAVVMKLPCVDSEAALCTLDEAQQLAQKHSSVIHHSSDFCCDYFLFAEEQTAYCVLLDTSSSLQEQYLAARDCGARLCIGLWSELGPDFYKKDSLPQ